MTVLDAYAVVAAIGGEPAAAEVETLLRGPQPSGISAVNLAEAVDVLVRRVGAPWPVVGASIELLRAGGLSVLGADQECALLAGEIRARQYHRSASPLSIADCFALATAMGAGRRLATADVSLARIARDMGSEIVALPGSRGMRP